MISDIPVNIFWEIVGYGDHHPNTLPQIIQIGELTISSFAKQLHEGRIALYCGDSEKKMPGQRVQGVALNRTPDSRDMAKRRGVHGRAR